MAKRSELSRRDFVKAGAAGVTLLLGNPLLDRASAEQAKMPQRTLGKTGVKVPILGLKSTVHFRADFQPIAETILVVQSPGAHITDPMEMPYKHLRKGIKLKPMGPVWNGA